MACVLLFPATAHAQRQIALTYDDAPRNAGVVFTGTERTDVLIKALASVNSGPVAFFVTTNGVESKASGHDRIARYAAAGHLIANHSHSHMWAHKMSTAEFLADVDKAERQLEGFENRKPWFRFPYLDEGRDERRVKMIANGLNERGLTNAYVTVDNYDWYVDQKLQEAVKAGREVNYTKLGQLYVQMMLYVAEYYDGIAVQRLGHSPVHVLLLHENDIAALYADDLVRTFRQAGWEVVSPERAYENPLPEPVTVRRSQGRVVALAADEGRKPSTMWTWALDEQMIDTWLDKSRVFSSPSE